MDEPAAEADLLVAGLRKLNFSGTGGGVGAPDPAVSTVTTDECIAHLKLLACFAHLRNKVATTDGLFNVRDSEMEVFPNKKTKARPLRCSERRDGLSM
jgi:hypothetical protein